MMIDMFLVQGYSAKAGFDQAVNIFEDYVLLWNTSMDVETSKMKKLARHETSKSTIALIPLFFKFAEAIKFELVNPTYESIIDSFFGELSGAEKYDKICKMAKDKEIPITEFIKSAVFLHDGTIVHLNKTFITMMEDEKASIIAFHLNKAYANYEGVLDL